MKTKIIALIILGVIPTVAFGNFTEVTNEIRTEANTGGNTINNGGTVIKGNAEASVQIKTEANGEEVASTSIEIKSDGEIKEFTKEETKTSEDGKTTVETKIELKVDAEDEPTMENQKQINAVNNNESVEPESLKETSSNNLVAAIIQIVLEKIKNLFSWFT